MTHIPNHPQFHKLRAIGIRHFDELIHDQPKEWLIKNFSTRAKVFPVNVDNLIRNIIWQTRERIINKEREPLNELIRTFWYMHIKPTLGRAGALSPTRDQYGDLVEQLVFLVVKKKLMKYSDIGFRDEGKLNRKVGLNYNVILFSEKLGHQDFLEEMTNLYQVSILALKGQPSALTGEYFVNELKKQGANLRRSFFLFSIVDYDPSGWSIRDTFMRNLMAFGISNVKYLDLIHPDMLSPEEIEYARYPIRDTKVTAKKNTAWLREIKQMDYENQEYLVPEMYRNNRILYGLEAESVSGKRIAEALKTQMVPYLGKSESTLKIQQLEKLHKAVEQLILQRITVKPPGGNYA